MHRLNWPARFVMAATMLAIVAAAAFLLMRGEDHQAAVRAAVDATCTAEQTRYVDISISDTATGLWTRNWSVRLDGIDYHGTNDDDPGEELIRKDGWLYHRAASDGPWQRSSSTGEPLNLCEPIGVATTSRSAISHYAHERIHYRFLGRVDLNGDLVKHYSTITNPTRSAEATTTGPEVVRTRIQFWVNDASRILKIQVNYIWMDGSGQSYPGVATVDLSGFGEVNTITVPEGITPPQPTAEPTPTPTATAIPAPEPEPLNGNPRAESVTATSVRISWDRLRPSGDNVRDYRVNYRLSANDEWTFGNYVDFSTFSQRRPEATVPRSGALQCNTEYEFQVQVELSNGLNDYGHFAARTGAC